MPQDNHNDEGAVSRVDGAPFRLTADGEPPLATLAGQPLLSNRGIPLNLDWVGQVRVNTSAMERRAQSHVARRTVKKGLAGRVVVARNYLHGFDYAFRRRHRRACAATLRQGAAARRTEIEKQLGIEELQIKVAAVCVYHRFVETAQRALWRGAESSRGGVGWLSGGAVSLEERVGEIRRSIDAGADEIDIVITRALVFGGRWQELYDEVAEFKRACGNVHMKAILGTGDLMTLRNVARASFVAMMAGADFIKTSTGKESTNAILPVGFVMTRAIREYAVETGMAVGFKPAGGIRTAKQSTEWLALIKEELGTPWMKAELFRFGASGLLNDIERQLEHYATGRYSADYRHPIA